MHECWGCEISDVGTAPTIMGLKTRTAEDKQDFYKVQKEKSLKVPGNVRHYGNYLHP